MKTAFAAFAIAAAAPVAAFAGTADFTDVPSVFSDSDPSTGVVDGVGISVTADPAGQLNTSTNPPSSTPPLNPFGDKILALDNDGFGVNLGTVDEADRAEQIIVSFTSGPALVNGLAFLDFFAAEDREGSVNETALVTFNNSVAGTSSSVTFTATAGKPSRGYFATTFDALLVDEIVFEAPSTGGEDGSNDFALAALHIVPLPASALLLMGALGGFAALSRKRSVA